MTGSEEVLVSLVRRALWGADGMRRADGRTHQGASLQSEDIDWRRVRELAEVHTVTGLAFEGLMTLPGELLPPHRVVIEWAAAREAIRRRGAAMDRAVAAVTGDLEAAGYHPIVVKGQTIARLYADPHIRQCGDIDVCLPPDEFRKLAADLRRRGASVSHVDGSVSYRAHGEEVELHDRIVDVSSRRAQRRMQRRTHQSASLQGVVIGGREVRTPGPEMTLLLMTAHIFKHTIGLGIGLRQICDMAVACREWGGKLDRELMERLIRDAGMERWTERLMSLLVYTLGMPREYLPYPVKISERMARPVERIVMRCGNFGSGLRGRGSKVRTAWTMLRHSAFSLRMAPRETLRYVADTIKGQRHE